MPRVVLWSWTFPSPKVPAGFWRARVPIARSWILTCTLFERRAHASAWNRKPVSLRNSIHATSIAEGRDPVGYFITVFELAYFLRP